MKRALEIINGSPLRGNIGTGDEDWDTPAAELALVKQVIPVIDLDPASNKFAQRRIRAGRYYTIDDNGLEQPWYGTVFLNPPHSKGKLLAFVSKLVEAYRAGNVTEAILLTHTFTDTEWFQLAAGACAAICFTRGRIKFVRGDEVTRSAATLGQIYFYFGANVEKFAQVFAARGSILVPCRKAKIQRAPLRQVA